MKLLLFFEVQAIVHCIDGRRIIEVGLRLMSILIFCLMPCMMILRVIVVYIIIITLFIVINVNIFIIANAINVIIINVIILYFFIN